MARWPRRRTQRWLCRTRRSTIRKNRCYWRNNEYDEVESDEQNVFSIKDDPKSFFTDTATTKQHNNAQTENCGRYCSAFAVLVRNGVRINQDAKIRALAVALGRNDKMLVSAFLQTRSQFGPVEVYKAITLLDTGRQVRVHERKLKRLELSKMRVNPHKLEKLRIIISNLNKRIMPVGAVSGAVCKHIRRWVKSLTREELEFYAIYFPKEPWKKLANICHFKPKDFPTALWFLPYCFGSEELPDDIEACLRLDKITVSQLITDEISPFSVVKKCLSSETEDCKERIAINLQKLDTVLLNYEDLMCPRVEEVIYQRLSRGDPVTLSNGKLFQIFFSIALGFDNHNQPHLEKVNSNFIKGLTEVVNQRLTSIRLPLESPIAILADKSESLQNSTFFSSTIITNLLTSICSAMSNSSNSVKTEAPVLLPPITEMLKSNPTITPNADYTLAAMLLPFYERKEKVKTFIVVTDKGKDDRFAPLFQKYHDEVFPASLVFISFREEFQELVIQLQQKGFNPKQLLLDKYRHRRHIKEFVDFFVQLFANCYFQDHLVAAEEEYKAKGVVKLFEGIQGADQVYVDED